MKDLGFDIDRTVTSIDSIAARCAIKLYNAIKAKRKLTARADITKWEEHFQLLIDMWSEVDIENAVDWYITRIGDKGIPQILSAEGFKKKYTSIKLKMGEDEEIEVSQDAKDIAMQLAPMNWPQGSDYTLPIMVERSMVNYLVFIGKIEKLKSKLMLNKNGHDSMLHLLQFFRQRRYLGFVRNFLFNWFAQVNLQINNWPDWSGSLRSFIFSEDSAMFNRMGRGWTYDYFHNSKYWDQLMKEIRKQ